MRMGTAGTARCRARGGAGARSAAGRNRGGSHGNAADDRGDLFRFVGAARGTRHLSVPVAENELLVDFSAFSAAIFINWHTFIPLAS
jgi:hypothetical protein